jgi:hypothetical protein
MAGFDGRMFLHDYEYETYKRRMPVRYLKTKLSKVCFVCGLPETSDNPFQRAHRIPFNAGILKFRLTPEYLDKDSNIVTAHRKLCNAAAELTEEQIVEFLSKQKPT